MSPTDTAPPSEPAPRLAFVVDDEAQVRTFVSNVLVSAGYQTRQLANGYDVEAAISAQSPDLIVLDLSLGNSDAIEVIRGLGASRYKGDVLLISGHAPSTLEDVVLVGRNRGLSMLPPLHKPFRVNELRERLTMVSRRVVGASADISLDAGLANGWLELWYQPKVNLRSNMLCGAEALIRLRHPTHGIIPPGRFLPMAGDALYRPLTDFIVRQALLDWSVFAKRKMTSRLAINVPASILQRPDFVQSVRRNLPTRADFPGLLVEITEDEAIEDPDLAREIAVQLKLYNVHVSIDDFGQGYSSLARLKELPFAEIKLDRSFVHGCALDSGKYKMCQAVIDLARRFKISAVAEGIEDAEDLRVLTELGYDVGQGYIFAKPMSAPDFLQLVSTRGRA